MKQICRACGKEETRDAVISHGIYRCIPCYIKSRVPQSNFLIDMALKEADDDRPRCSETEGFWHHPNLPRFGW
jgi:hypothetical protein